MQIENVGKHQLHLIAHELPAGGWDPFVTICRFDDTKNDFVCLIEKYHVEKGPYPSYEQAIRAATEAGNALIQAGLKKSHVAAST